MSSACLRGFYQCLDISWAQSKQNVKDEKLNVSLLYSSAWFSLFHLFCHRFHAPAPCFRTEPTLLLYHPCVAMLSTKTESLYGVRVSSAGIWKSDVDRGTIPILKPFENWTYIWIQIGQTKLLQTKLHSVCGDVRTAGQWRSHRLNWKLCLGSGMPACQRQQLQHGPSSCIGSCFQGTSPFCSCCALWLEPWGRWQPWGFLALPLLSPLLTT